MGNDEDLKCDRDTTRVTDVGTATTLALVGGRALEPHTPRTAPAVHMTGDIVDVRACPSCGVDVGVIHRPGRPRVYCRQRCRQRAYRWRRAHDACTRATPVAHAERAITPHGRRHALRSQRDPVARLVDHLQREVTVCGTFARPARSGPTRHTRFLPGADHSCATCTAIVTTGLSDDVGPHFPDPRTGDRHWFAEFERWLADPCSWCASA